MDLYELYAPLMLSCDGALKVSASLHPNLIFFLLSPDSRKDFFKMDSELFSFITV